MHCQEPCQDGTSNTGAQMSIPPQSRLFMQALQVSTRITSSTSTMPTQLRPGLQLSCDSQPLPCAPKLHVGASFPNGLKEVQPPSGQSRSSSHSPQRPVTNGMIKQLPESHSSSLLQAAPLL